MTELDFLAAGVRFVRDWMGLRVRGPRDRRELAEQLRAEVNRRKGLARDPRRAYDGERCELCGDLLGNGRQGWCQLCALARQEVLVESGRITPTRLAPVEDEEAARAA